MKLRSLLILILIFTVPNLGIFSQSKKQTVAVLEFNSNSRQIGKDELATLTSRFRTMLVKTDAFDVLERQKMSDILKEQNFTISDNCNSAECAVQVGQLLGVELMIAGDVGKLGDTYSVDLRLISVSTGKIIQTEAQNHEGKIDGLFGVLTSIANSFAGIKSNTSSAETQIAADGTFTDPRDGQKYRTVKIGNQIWMAENLNYYTTHGSWCYNDDSFFCEKYGRLYNWETAFKAVPPGWHLPTYTEWIILSSYLGGEEVAGGKLKETGTERWFVSSKGANNESGFCARPAGARGESGDFILLNQYAYFWSASENDAVTAWVRILKNDWDGIGNYPSAKRAAFSVRCVKD